MDDNQRVTTENINEVILRLLKLKSGEEMDYQTYAKKIKLKLSSSRMVGKFIPAEEDELLRNEFKRVRNKKGRFIILKTKKTRISSPPPPPRSGGKTPPRTGSIVKSKPGKITADNYFYQNFVQPVNVKDVTKKTATVSRKTDPLIRISNTLDSILETLTNINNFDREQVNRGRRDAENRRRTQRESQLESKPFEGIKKVLSAITKPFQSIWDKIVNFITNVILGRIVIKLINWIADPGNQGKIQSIIRFLGDHWPTLLALYLRFGTGIGRFVGKLTRSLVKGSAKLIKLTAELAAKIGLKRAGKLASFLGGPRGRAIATGVGIAADVAVTAGTAFGVSKLFGGEDKKQEPVQKFAGGGFANFGNMFKGAGFGSMFGPLGMLAGVALGSGKPQEMFNGLVSGPGGPKGDMINARLSDGEFVMSAGAVKKYGVDTLEAMNAAGGGDNQPKVVGGTTYAAGGGLVGETPKEIRLRQAYESKLGKDLTSKLTNNQISQISKYYNSLPSKEASNIDSKIIKGFGNPLRDMAEQMIRGNKPGSVTRSINALHSSEDILTDAIKYNRSELRQTGSRLKTTRIDPSRMLPAAGQSSANDMKAVAKAASRIRRSIPASRAIVPYTGGGLSRTGVTAGLSELDLQQIYTNMNVPGGAKRSSLMRFLNNPATRFAGKATRVLDAPVIGDMILPEGTSEYDQRSNVYNDPRLSPVQRRIMMESVGLRGGAMKGGLGLKEQSFKDAPKTQIMTDDKGRPFVGYKALRSGKLTYIRGPQSGAGSSNMWENFGRMINPDAYNDIDKLNARKKYEEASRNSVSSLRARGASQATISRTQSRLNRSVPPLPRPQSKPQVAGGGMGGRRGSGAKPSSGSKPPSFSAKHNKGTSVSVSAYGIMR